MVDENDNVTSDDMDTMEALRQQHSKDKSLAAVKPQTPETVTRAEGDVDAATGAAAKRFREGGTGR